MQFWANDGHIEPGTGGNLDQDKQVYPNQPNYSDTNNLPNYAYGQIRSQRNLENFARLWVCGLPNLPTNQGYTVTMTQHHDSYGGIVNLYPAYESDGGTRYLTDTNIAAMQIGSPYGTNIAQLASYWYWLPDYTLPVDNNGKPLITHFLFEGAGEPGWSDGTGGDYPMLTIWQNGEVVAQTTAYVNFSHARDLYERATVTNVIQTWPEMVQQRQTSGFQVMSTPGYNPNELTNWRCSFMVGE